MALAKRFGNFQPFVRTKAYNDNRNGNIEIGVVTYSIDENNQEAYQVSSAEIGGRSDHISDVLQSLTGNEPDKLSTASSLKGDAELMRKATEPKSAKSASEASA